MKLKLENWKLDSTKYLPQPKVGVLGVIKRERERERERKKSVLYPFHESLI